MELDARQTLLLACLVLFAGRYLTNHVRFLRTYNIPEPVSGGVLASAVFAIVHAIWGFHFEFFLNSRDSLLIIFFTTIGLTAELKTLIRGGKPLCILLVLAVSYLVVQNITGIAVAEVSGLTPYFGLVGGSISLSGGHGTAIAWASIFENEHGVSGAMEIGIACATFGLVLGGLIGGPIAKGLIEHYKLEPAEITEPTIGLAHDTESASIDYDQMIAVFFILCCAIGLGVHLNVLFANFGLKLPDFVSCLFAGIVITNTVPYLLPKVHWNTESPSLKLVSDVSLGLFLSMSLMSLQLWTLVDLAGPIMLMLAAQLIAVVLFTIFVVFRALGKTYDAAVIASGYAGLALGATPTAIANMTAVTQRFGGSQLAFIVVPLVGAFFIDISNAVIIQSLLDWLG